MNRKNRLYNVSGQAHGHTSANCNKKVVCVKCAELHDSRNCSKTPEIPLV